MDLATKLDFNVVAMDRGETVHLLLELTAPELEGWRRRDPASLQVVLDRSGSMGGERLHSALRAISSLAGRLAPEDRFGLVCFDDTVQVPVAAGPVGDAGLIKAALNSIESGGMTNLSAGLMRGVQEAERVRGDGASTLVLLSDGHANEGITGHGELEGIARAAEEKRITISSIGIGEGYDENLLEAVSRGSGGNSHFAADGDAAGGYLAGEVEGLLEQVVQAASLIVRPAGTVAAVRLFNDLPVAGLPGGFMVELGELAGGEQRKLLFEIDVPDIAALGLAQVCEMELRWVETATMKSRMATIPVHVNVVPGDEAAGRIANPEVRTELTFQQVQRSKREASDALARGDHAAARRLWADSRQRLDSLDRNRLSDGELLDIEEEEVMLGQIEQQAELDANLASKLSISDYHRKSRKRGRDIRGGE